MRIEIILKYLLFAFMSLTLLIFGSRLSYGQVDDNKDISISASVIDSTTLISGDTKIYLWGIEKIDADVAVFHLKIRKSLEKKIGSDNILCTVKKRISSNVIKAQCINSKEEDLSLFLLRQGYASADRKTIYGSIYEHPYLNAEESAQIDEVGVWGGDKSNGDKQSKDFLMGAFSLVIVFILALGVISFHIMRGFSKVIDVQNKTIKLAAKERNLKDKEKFIIAAMIDAEVRSNKVKIEAYLTIYEETLKGFDVSNQTPEYQKAGDIVQKQPSLSRSVFDGNTNKLDLLGSVLASNIIHYYARIKTTNEYIEISLDTPREEAKQIIEDVIENASKLNSVSKQLTELFIQHALIKPILE